MSESYEEHVMKAMSNPNYPFDQEGRPPALRKADLQQGSTHRRLSEEEREAWRLKQGVDRIGPTQEEFQTLVTWVRVLEERLQALEAKE